VLLLDEPLSNLDAKLRIHMRQELLELQRKLSLTTIFVTHDQEEANTTADRIAVIKDGRVQQIGTPMHLYDHPTNLFVAQFLGSANVLKGMLRKIDNSAVFETDDGLKVPLATAEIEGSRSLVLRPQNITLCPTDAQPGDLQGKVHKREFLGNIVRYDILVGQQHLIVDEVYGQGQKPAEAGQSVALKLDHQHILIMDAE
jgi:iron(III) transport system ATP-binding protein